MQSQIQIKINTNCIFVYCTWKNTFEYQNLKTQVLKVIEIEWTYEKTKPTKKPLFFLLPVARTDTKFCYTFLFYTILTIYYLAQAKQELKTLFIFKIMKVFDFIRVYIFRIQTNSELIHVFYAASTGTWQLPFNAPCYSICFCHSRSLMSLCLHFMHVLSSYSHFIDMRCENTNF